MGRVGNQLSVFLLHPLPVDTVHVWIVEEIPLQSPGLVEHLLPLALRVHLHLHPRGSQLAVADLVASLLGIDDSESPAAAVDYLLPVGGDVVAIDPGDKGLFLPLLHVEHAQLILSPAGTTSFTDGGHGQIKQFAFCSLESIVISGTDRDSDHSLVDPLKIDLNLLVLFFVLILLLVLILILLLVLFLLLVLLHLLLVALRCKGRKAVRLQGH